MNSSNPTDGRPDSFLRLVREARGWTQKDLAEAAGITKVAISHLETGRSEPRLTTARKLADALDVEVEEIFPNDGGSPSQVLLDRHKEAVERKRLRRKSVRS